MKNHVSKMMVTEMDWGGEANQSVTLGLFIIKWRLRLNGG